MQLPKLCRAHLSGGRDSTRRGGGGEWQEQVQLADMPQSGVAAMIDCMVTVEITMHFDSSHKFLKHHHARICIESSQICQILPLNRLSLFHPEVLQLWAGDQFYRPRWAEICPKHTQDIM